jgi:hypothetical protein
MRSQYKPKFQSESKYCDTEMYRSSLTAAIFLDKWKTFVELLAEAVLLSLLV